MKAKQSKKKVVHSESVTQGKENIFADLGFSKSKAADLKTKAHLTMRICQRITSLNFTQTSAARQLGLSQPDVSKLMNGRYTGYSIERLLSLLNALEVDIDIIIRPKHHARNTAPGVVRVLEVA